MRSIDVVLISRLRIFALSYAKRFDFNYREKRIAAPSSRKTRKLNADSVDKFLERCIVGKVGRNSKGDCYLTLVNTGYPSRLLVTDIIDDFLQV